jgi:hypothetical protein
MSATSVSCARILRALRAARASSASTSGNARSVPNAREHQLVAHDTAVRLRFASSHTGGFGLPSNTSTRCDTATTHPAFPTAPTWSTADLLHPKTETHGDDVDGDKHGDDVTAHELAALARRANLPPPVGDAAVDAARGVNEILRFVRALDKVTDVEHLEPMWTTVEDDFRVATPRANGNNEKDDDENGWCAIPRDDLLAVAPKRTRDRTPHFVAATGITPGETSLAVDEEG